MVKDAKPPFSAVELREWLLAGRSAADIITKTNIKPSTIKLEACVAAFEMAVAAAADVVASSRGKAALKPASSNPAASAASTASYASVLAPSAPESESQGQVNNDDEPATPRRPPRPKVTDTFCPDFLEKTACSKGGNCGLSHEMCHDSECRRSVKLKDGSVASMLNVQPGCSGWHLPIKYSVLVAQREREKEERLSRAASRREREDLKAKIVDVIKDIPGLNVDSKAAKASKGGPSSAGKDGNNGNKSGNGKGGPPASKGGPPTLTKQEIKDGWKVVKTRGRGRRTTTKKTKTNSSLQKSQSQKKTRSLEEKIEALIDRKLAAMAK